MTQSPGSRRQTAMPCDVMRGGTSKGLVFLRDDLPADRARRDAVLLAAMGSPDEREIDGLGGAHPLTSKVAVVVPRPRATDADVDYLFLQVWPDRPEVSDKQNCGNMLAAVGPFAIEHGLVAAGDDVTPVRIWMENTDTLAVAYVETPGGAVRYDGDARIDGVPGTHAPIPLEFVDIAGSSCGALLPDGQRRRRGRRRARHLHRQRHAGGVPRGRRLRAHRRGDAGRDRGDARGQGAHRGGPARGRAADEPRRRRRTRPCRR